MRQKTRDVSLFVVEKNSNVNRIRSIRPRIIDERNQSRFIGVERKKHFRALMIEGEIDVMPRVDLVVIGDRRLKLIIETRRTRQGEIPLAELKFQRFVFERVIQMETKILREQMKIVAVLRMKMFQTQQIDVGQTGLIAESETFAGKFARGEGEDEEKRKKKKKFVHLVVRSSRDEMTIIPDEQTNANAKTTTGQSNDESKDQTNDIGRRSCISSKEKSLNLFPSPFHSHRHVNAGIASI